MSDTSSNQPNSSTENHRAAIDELINGESPVPVVETQPAAAVIEPTTEPAPVVTPEVPTETTPEVITPAADAPSTDIYQKLAEISEGLVKSEDDFKSIYQKAQKFSDLESQNLTLAQERDALKNATPYANKYVEKLNDLYKSGASTEKIDLFNRINQLPIADMSSKDAVKWQLMEQYGLTSDQADVKIRTTYRNDETLYSEDEVSAANIDLKIEGDKAKAYLQALQVSSEVQAPEPVVQETPEQIAQKNLQYEAQLTPVIKSIEQELPGLFSKINVNGKQGDAAITIDLPVPADVQTTIAANVKQYAKDFNVDLSNPENVKGLKDYAANLTKIAMFDSWMIDVSNKREEAIRAEFHNPSNINRGPDNPAAPAKSTRESVAANIASTF